MRLMFARQTATGFEHAEFSGERLVNWYLQPHPDQGGAPAILAPSPGLTLFSTLSLGDPVRAIHVQHSVAYAACGGELWQVTAAGVATSLGWIGDDQNTTVTGNGSDVAVASGGLYFVWDGATLQNTSPGAFTDAGSVTRLDNYVIISELNGQRFSYSALGDASDVDALDFASAESAPDDVVRVLADHSELWFFGTRSTEVWGNGGNPDLPFQRISGGVIERGCAFPNAVGKDDNSVFWVGDDRLVYRAQGYTPTVISPPWVSERLEALADSADVQGFPISWRGAKQYVLRLPSDRSLVFDAATGLWHERDSGTEGGPWLGRCADRMGAATLVGGNDGRIYTLGGLTDGGTTIVREAVSLPVMSRGERITVSNVAVQFRTGATDIGREAQVMMQCSVDGRTWGRERWRTLGGIGNYRKRASWSGFGVGRQFQFRVRISDPIETALYGAEIAAS